jgi:hypothetical protein
LIGGLAVPAVAGLGWAATQFGSDIVPPLAEVLPGSGPAERPVPVARDTLPAYASLAEARLVYEITGRPALVHLDSGYAARLAASLTDLTGLAGWAPPAQIWNYGGWVPEDGDGPSWHPAGRAFDLSRIRDAQGRDLVTCRFDEWGSLDEARRAPLERAYWKAAAILHRDFAHVLTYLTDTAHHNHIHVDNGRSGAGQSTLRTRSKAQVSAVQAMCRHVWGRDVQPSGQWDDVTRGATTRILGSIGVPGGLTDGQDRWHAFLVATARHTL